MGRACERVLPALLIPVLAVACAIVGSKPRDTGAFDRILIGDRDHEVGPFVFPHRMHYGPESEGGQAIPCSRCHHDYKPDAATPPTSCRKCHLGHDEWPDPKRPYL